MSKILYAPASPFSSKVRMSAAYVGYPAESVAVDTGQEPDLLVNANPLGKIPVLVLEDGTGIFDSRAITQWLNRESRGALFPRNPARRTEAERLEALADGICDSLIAQVYERRKRPEEKVHQPWLELHERKVGRALDLLESSLPRIPKKIHAGHIALRAMLGYMELRFPGQWEKGRKKLTRWPRQFDQKFPELQEFLPRA